MIKKFILCAVAGLLLSNCAFARDCEIVHKSVNFYEKQIAEHPNYVCAFYNLANEYYLKKKYQEALNTYKDLIALYPKEERAYIKRAQIYHKFKQEDYAAREYGRLVKNVPESVFGNEQMAYIYQNLSDYDNALRYINKAIELTQEEDSDINWRIYQRAKILKDMSKYEEAIEDFTKYTKSDAKYNYDGYSEISECYKSLGNTAKEKEAYAKWSYSLKKNKHKIGLIRNIKWYYHKFKPDFVY